MSDISNREELRKHVVAAVVAFLKRRSAETGLSHWGFDDEVEATFPGIPSDVLANACLVLDDEKAEAWWDSLTKTIEGQVVTNALTAGGAR